MVSINANEAPNTWLVTSGWSLVILPEMQWHGWGERGPSLIWENALGALLYVD